MDRLSVSVQDSSQEFTVQDLPDRRLITGISARILKFLHFHSKKMLDVQTEIMQLIYISVTNMKIFLQMAIGKEYLQASQKYSLRKRREHGLMVIQM